MCRIRLRDEARCRKLISHRCPRCVRFRHHDERYNTMCARYSRDSCLLRNAVSLLTSLSYPRICTFTRISRQIRSACRVLINRILLPPSRLPLSFAVPFTLRWVDTRRYRAVVPFLRWLLSFGEKGEESTRQAEAIAHSGYAAVAGKLAVLAVSN